MTGLSGALAVLAAAFLCWVAALFLRRLAPAALSMPAQPRDVLPLRVTSRVVQRRLADPAPALMVGNAAAPSMPAEELTPEQRLTELTVLQEITRTISASLDLGTILRAILTSTRRLIAFDLGEVTLWNPVQRVMVSRGSLDADEYHAAVGDTYRLDEGYSGWLARNRQPLLIDDVPGCQTVRPKLDRLDIPLGSFLGIPLESRGEFVGTLELISFQPAAFSRHALELLQAIGLQAAMAIEHARLYEEARRRALELSSLARVSAAVGSTLDPNAVLQAIVRSVLEVVGCNRSAIFVVDEDAGVLRLTASYGLSQNYVDESQALPIEPGGRTHAVAIGMPVMVEDLEADPALRQVAPFAEKENFRAFADIPLKVGERVTGMLTVSFTHAHRFIDTERDLLMSFADQAAIAINNAQLYSRADQALQRRTRALSGLQRVARELSATFDLQYILRIVLEEALQISNSCYCAVLLYDSSVEQWELAICAGYMEEQQAILRQRLRDLPERDALSELNRLGQAIYLPDAATEGWEVAGQADVRTALLSPIRYGDDLCGALVLGTPQVDAFDDEVRQFVETLSTQVAVAISNSRRHQEQLDRNALIRRRADQLSRVLQVTQEIRSDHPLEDVLEEIAYAIQESVGFDTVLISVTRGDPPVLHRMAAAGLSRSVLEQMKQVTQPLKATEVVMRGEFRISQSYYVPAEQQDRWRGTLDVYDSMHQGIEREPGMWHAHDMLLVPLVGPSGQLQGLISVDDPRDGKVPDFPVVEALEVFAGQAAVAVENAQLLEMLERRLDTLSIFNELSHSITAKLDLDEVLQKVVDAVPRLVDCQGSIVFLQEPLSKRYVARSAFGHDLAVLLAQAVLGNGMIESVARSGMPVTVTAAEQQQITPSSMELGARILVPLGYGDRAAGVLTADRSSSEPFTPTDVATISALADQVAVAVDNARLYEEASNQARQLALINRVATAVNATLDLDGLIETIHQQIAPIFQADAFFLALYDHETDELDFRLFVDEGERVSVGRRPLGTGLTSHVITEKRPLLLSHRDDWLERAPAPVYQGQPADSWLGVPMMSGDEVLGVICVQAYRPLAFGEVEQQLLSTIADQVALAVRNARLFDESQRRAQELSTLLDAGSTLSSSLDLTWVLQALGDRLMSVANADSCLISEWEREENRVTVIWEMGDPSIRPMFGAVYAAHERAAVLDVILTQESTLLTADAPQLDESTRAYLDKRQAQSILILAMVARGQTVGLVELERRQGRPPFVSEEIHLAQAFANQAAAALQNARLYEEILRFSEELEQRVERRTHELAQALQELTAERDRVEALYRITAEVYASLDLDPVLNRTLELVTKAVGAERGTILLEDPESRELIYRSAFGVGIQVPPGGIATRFRRGEGLAWWIMARGEAVCIDDLSRDPRWLPSQIAEPTHHACLGLPLGRVGEVQGVMMLFSATPGAFTEDHLRLAEAAARQIANAVGNAGLYQLISEQAKRLGAMLKQQQVEATKSQAILEGVADGVVVAGADGRIILFNAAAERILEIPRDRALGRSTREMMGLYGVTGRKWLEAIEEWSERPVAQTPESFVAERLEFGQRVVSVHVAPVVMGSEYLGTVSVFRDITAIVEADRAKSEFVSTVSHELRTPMTSIKGYADLLMMGAVGDLSEQQSRFMSIIRNNADRLTDLVNDLLDISRIETGRVSLDLHALHIHELVEQMTTMFEGRVQQQDQTLVSTVSADLPPVWGDSARVVQILVNLIGNAINYTPRGGTITIAAEQVDDMLQISVRDTGIGISPPNQAKIFERFFRADDPLVQEKAGTGLGLPITASLVQMHKGNIWVDSMVGEGSTFYFTLPLASTVQHAAALDNAGAQLLVVEKDPALARSISAALEKEGYAVATVAGIEQALPAMQELHPVLVLFDLQNQDAHAALRQLIGDGTSEGIPVAVMNGEPGDVEQAWEQAWQRGALHFIEETVAADGWTDKISALLISLAQQRSAD